MLDCWRVTTLLVDLVFQFHVCFLVSGIVFAFSLLFLLRCRLVGCCNLAVGIFLQQHVRRILGSVTRSHSPQMNIELLGVVCLSIALFFWLLFCSVDSLQALYESTRR